jgi:hypothetical protein
MKRTELLNQIKNHILKEVQVKTSKVSKDNPNIFVVAKVTYKPEDYTKYVRFAQGTYTGNSPEQYLKNAIQLRQREKKEFDPNTLSYYFNQDGNMENYEVEFIETGLSANEATRMANQKNQELGIKDKRLGGLAGVSNPIEVDKKDIIGPMKDGFYYIDKMALPKYKTLKVDKKIETVINGFNKFTKKPKSWTYLKITSQIKPTTSLTK